MGRKGTTAAARFGRCRIERLSDQAAPQLFLPPLGRPDPVADLLRPVSPRHTPYPIPTLLRQDPTRGRLEEGISVIGGGGIGNTANAAIIASFHSGGGGGGGGEAGSFLANYRGRAGSSASVAQDARGLPEAVTTAQGRNLVVYQLDRHVL